MAGALKPDLSSPEPLPEADLLGRTAVSTVSTTTDTKILQEEDDGKETLWDTRVQLEDILALRGKKKHMRNRRDQLEELEQVSWGALIFLHSFIFQQN